MNDGIARAVNVVDTGFGNFGDNQDYSCPRWNHCEIVY